MLPTTPLLDRSRSQPRGSVRSQTYVALVSGLTLVGALIATADTARALDPSRALTQYIHRIWHTQQGLPPGTIFAIRQPQDGYLWLATQTGLFRFDGVQFTAVRDADNQLLASAWVRDLREDADDSDWIATDGAGLIRWHDGVATQFTVADGL